MNLANEDLAAKIFERVSLLAVRRHHGIKPTAKQIEFLCTCVDVFHNRGNHHYANYIDDVMCEWCELLIDA